MVPTWRDKVLDEIRRVPDENLKTVYEFIHYFRVGIEETAGTNPGPGEKFSDLPGEAFDHFVEKIARRRKHRGNRCE